MAKVIDYLLLQAPSDVELTALVMTFVQNGWDLQGGISVTSPNHVPKANFPGAPSITYIPSLWYAQAVVRLSN